MTEAIWYRLASPARPGPPPPPPPPQKKKKKKKKKKIYNHSDRLKSCLYDKDFQSCFRLFYGSLSLILNSFALIYVYLEQTILMNAHLRYLLQGRSLLCHSHIANCLLSARPVMRSFCIFSTTKLIYACSC